MRFFRSSVSTSSSSSRVSSRRSAAMSAPRFFNAVVLVLLSFCVLPTFALNKKILQSNSLSACSDNTGLSASKFNVTFVPDTGIVWFDVLLTSSIQEEVMFSANIYAYGYNFLKQEFDPCEDEDFKGMCPMSAGRQISLKFNYNIPKEDLKQIPGITYTVPDLDAVVRVNVTKKKTGESVACLEASVVNGATVNLVGVKVATAVIIILALLVASFLSGLGYSNAAAHVAANSLSLLGYFQAQAFIGQTAVRMPPIVQAWTQDLQWSAGLIRIPFIQRAVQWYQRATSGTASRTLDELDEKSVQVAKRAVGALASTVSSVVAEVPRRIMKRQNIETEEGGIIVFGIQRVAFKEYIETTNVVMTAFSTFWIVVILVVFLFFLFKVVVDLLVKRETIRRDAFYDFRTEWKTVLKGMFLRLTIVGLPPIATMCLWEFTQNDSPAIMVLAVFFLLGMFASLAWAAFKIITIARSSRSIHGNPAYTLYSDPSVINRWGFLYVQYRASASYFIGPTLIYIFVKAAVVAFGQKEGGLAHGVAFIVLEIIALIAVSVLRPWMDKTTNTFNIAICVMNFVNSIFLFIFINVFDLPQLVVGVVGVVFFVLNAAFAFVLLMIIIISTVLIILREQPELKYQSMDDDRTSFMRSQASLGGPSTELDALAATARGAGKNASMEDQSSSQPDMSLREKGSDRFQQQFPQPVNTSLNMFPADSRSPSRTNSPHPMQTRSDAQSFTSGHHPNPNIQRSASPWQRGAGYDA